MKGWVAAAGLAGEAPPPGSTDTPPAPPPPVPPLQHPDERLEKKGPPGMVLPVGRSTGEGALSEKLEKGLFVGPLAVKCCAPSSPAPSPARLAGRREKPSCCDPICLLLIHILLSVPRAWQWGQGFSCQKLWVSIEYSQEGRLRNVSLHQNCLL